MIPPEEKRPNPAARNLKRMLIRRYGIVVVLVFLAVSLLAVIPVRSSVLGIEKKRLQGDAEVIAGTAAQYIKQGRGADLSGLTSIIAPPNAELRVTLIDAEGKVLSDSEQDPASLPNQADLPEFLSALAGNITCVIREYGSVGPAGNFFFAAAPVTLDSSIVGAARVSKAEAEVDPLIFRIWGIFLGALGLVLLTVVLISLWTHGTIMRGISGVKEAASAIAAGSLDRRVPEPDIEEFSELARSMNAMSAQVKEDLVELSEQKGKLETVLTSISAGILVTDTENRILLMNPAAEALMGITAAAALGARVIEIFPSHEIDLAFARATKGEKVDEQHTLIYPVKMTLRVEVTPVLGASGEPVSTVGVVEDVTAAKRLERIRKDFVANVSHELRTPVATAKALVDALLAGAAAEPATAERFLGSLDQEVSRLAQLIEDLLALSRLEAEETHIRLEPLSVAALLEDAVERKARLAADYQVIVKTKLDYTGEIRGDRKLLDTVFNNLLDNAIKYNRPGGDVTVASAVADTGNAVELSVTDTGIGIPEEDLPRIFERFYRVDKARSRDTGGTGLGLSIVKHIAEVHGGSVSVESEEGMGSRFTLRAPKV